MSAAIEFVSVTKDYNRRVRAVDSLSLSVPEGSLFGLIGPNGAGKTTTFALLSGFLQPTAGEIRVRGRLLAPGRPPVGSVLSLPQDASLPASKKVLQALVFLGRLGGLGADEARSLSVRALERVGLSDLADRKVTQLSHGQRRRVGIAQTLVGRGEVIVLDEPTAGLDPRTANELGGLIKSLHADRTIVMSSHNLSEMQALCTHAAILDKGHLVAAGTMDEILGTGAMFTIVLNAPLADPPPLLDALRGLPGAVKVSLEGQQDRLRVECETSDGVENLTSAAVSEVIEAGGSLKSVERGQSLVDKFMDATGR